ncbi:unnamed protein product [Bursaphelenchus xylophilus]|uniref:pantothenate kinase n=1 Tax=Bursaphelenchus xylophilus TaxID=6326 RepID=A0A1I7RZ04_BURXY|nr:unnamed protein product [Bursaphelenchus xylophilus]CAG9106983.1 unnamed protein product [Bursaphelenchus xylophilus]
MGIQNRDPESLILEFLGHVKRQRHQSLPLILPRELGLPMPWFGLDIGGTLTKLVYFEPSHTDYILESDEEFQRGKNIRQYLLSRSAYGEHGIRDKHLQLDDVNINGRCGSIHFIRFPTDRMLNFIQLVKSKGFTQMSSTVCATGGGAVKYALETEKELNMSLHKSDELESLIKGIELIAANNPNECYYYDKPLEGENKVIWRWSSARSSTTDYKYINQPCEEGLQYPYVLCNIGSGVSVMVVKGRNDFQRVSGSSIGGGFFNGLCSLLCGVESFEEAIDLATQGDNKNVDILVGDIYGSGYDSIGLPSDTVAASFGKACTKAGRESMSRADLARSALATVANNIGATALSVATQNNIERIVFVGNFLRVNPLAARLLAYAMEFWSKGTKRALFLNHEGYFGAVGCLDKLVEVTQSRNIPTMGV